MGVKEVRGGVEISRAKVGRASGTGSGCWESLGDRVHLPCGG